MIYDKMESSEIGIQCILLYVRTYYIRQNGILRNQNLKCHIVHPNLRYTTKWNIQRLEPKASYHIPKFMICNKWNILITVDRNPSMHSQIGKDTKHPCNIICYRSPLNIIQQVQIDFQGGGSEFLYFVKRRNPLNIAKNRSRSTCFSPITFRNHTDCKYDTTANIYRNSFFRENNKSQFDIQVPQFYKRFQIS